MTVAQKVETLRPGTDWALISIYHPLADSISDCLAPHGEDLAELTQALLICHFAEQSTSQGQVQSETTRTGASASYKTINGTGLASTRFGQQILLLPTAGCVQQIVKPEQFARSIVPCR